MGGCLRGQPLLFLSYLTVIELFAMQAPASKIIMVRPTGFGFNPQTAESNAFQQRLDLEPSEIKLRATSEFDTMAAKLRGLNVELVVIEEADGEQTPDAVFPNNVFSTHPDGTFCVYPMEAEARRLERQLIPSIREHFKSSRILDLTCFEEAGKYLEGTGSLVLDHENKIAFACLSTRTHIEVLDFWAKEMGFEVCSFRAVDDAGMDIYHTNVMMCLGDGFAVACTSSIADPTERANFLNKIHQTKRELIEISFEQMNSFAGNMIQITDKDGARLLLMSETALHSLSPEQIERLNSYARLESFNIETIEQCGGGSVRCMIAEVF